MSPLSKASPFRDGFAALRHEPALLAAELTWRWCFGLSALVLGFLSAALFLDTLTVSRVDEFLLSTLQPQLLAEAIRHIFHGSLARFLLEQGLLVLGLTLLWSFASAAGRAATLRRMVEMFSVGDEPQPMQWHVGSIFLLHLLRALWTQIALVAVLILGVYGVLMAHQRPISAALALSAGMAFAGFIGFSLNWYLGVAPLFCIRNGATARDAVDQAMEFSGRRGGRLFLLGLGFFALRLIWTGTMWLAFIAPLHLAGKINGRWIALLMAVVAMIYFAGADYLGLARWGAYVSLTEDDASPTGEPEAPQPPPAPVEILSLEGLA